MNYQYKFEEHPAPKGTCPSCGVKNTFRFYQDQPREFGKCERINACGYSKQPSGDELLNIEKPFNIKPEKKVVYPDKNECDSLVKSDTSTFHIACKSLLNIPQDHFEKWKVGSTGSKTAFVFSDFLGKAVNVKFIQYEEKCKRNKSVNPHSLSPKNKEEKYSTCLFGEHILTDKTICLVESEKTAFIASYFYPQFDWLATGSRNGLTDGKVKVLFNKNVLYLPDADSAGRENSTINKLNFHKINFKLIDLFPERDDGFDLADSIMAGNLMDINEKTCTTTKVINEHLNDNDTVENIEAPKRKTQKESRFETVKKFIQERYDLRYNIVANEIEIKPLDETKFGILNINNLFVELEHDFKQISMGNLEAILRSNFVPIYNPIKDYFENLSSWRKDIDVDFIDKLCRYIIVGHSDLNRFRNHLQKHLVRTIKCALEDHYFNKQCLVFVTGKQSTGKTTLIRWFCPSTLSHFINEAIGSDKDGLIALAENFILNIDELATLDKKGMKGLKSIFSKDRVKVRPPFGKKAVMMPRRASFFGSTDQLEFLNDDAGTVRWICFQLNEINWAYSSEINVDDVWRQAFALYKNGFNGELTTTELRENEEANRIFKVNTAESELINSSYIPGDKENHDVFLTASQVLNELTLKYQTVKLNHYNIGRAFRMLDFKQCQDRVDKPYSVKGYFLIWRKE